MQIVGCLAHYKVAKGAIKLAIRQSFLVSTDMAPGVHPDFMEKHGENQWSEMQQDLLSISLFFGCSVRERDAQRKIYRHYVQVFQGILS
ncbi:hypothetical protein POPTR_010G237667v4 [Populus trichocarpa]|uniref:Uncharacterized protein n=1 Tax=Populus trichocarpa TaxID=3694 RepID=A0ACC0SF96_POPTR|nr:hypothetical protein BDE02_10G213600 [Populus trichocarpa]KAI9387895.1 hypothetical protein POPTR_010G237667v4 [Populus trichocarpa]